MAWRPQSTAWRFAKVRPFVATFFVFIDYLQPSLRLAAHRQLPVIYVFTHDSIGLGEDGPTHQPIEHLAAMRAIPNIMVIRPGDANEVVETWRDVMPLKDGRRRWCLRGKTCRRSIARNMPRPAAWRAERMCWPTRRKESRR